LQAAPAAGASEAAAGEVQGGFTRGLAMRQPKSGAYAKA